MQRPYSSTAWLAFDASDPIPSHRRCLESVHAKTGKDASNSYSRDGKAKVIKAIGLLETLNSVSLCYELLLKQQEGILTKQRERRIREHLCGDI